MSYARDDVLTDLQENVVEVTFIKNSGDRRVMKCTLDPRYLPGNYDRDRMISEHHKEENKETLVVWDVIANGWRSFRIDSVEYVQVVEG